MSGHMNAPLSSISAGARRRMRFWQQRYLFLMLLPTLVVVTMFAYKPIINWIIAFRDYQVGFSIFKGSWQGFKYFTEFFRDSADAGHVIKNTLVINIASLFINLSCAMVFAILLNELRSNKVRRIMQSFSIFPFFVSWVITYSFCRVFFNAGSGLVNALLINMGVIRKGINILGDPRHSYALIIGANLWKSLGYNSVIFLATIAGIDQEQYEAADIDGATASPENTLHHHSESCSYPGCAVGSKQRLDPKLQFRTILSILESHEPRRHRSFRYVCISVRAETGALLVRDGGGYI